MHWHSSFSHSHIPKITQLDQGSNFSYVFAGVEAAPCLAQPVLGLSCSEPGSTRALPPNLEVIITCLLYQVGSWEDELPWLMLAAREVTQESTEFSPNELVFVHTVRDALVVLADNWRETQPPKNLIYFRAVVHSWGTGQREAEAQVKMKHLFDRNSERCVLPRGDQVLALFPLPTSPFKGKVHRSGYNFKTSVRAELCNFNTLP